MTVWRMKLADWISGGAITKLDVENDMLFTQYIGQSNSADELGYALIQIIECETPGANATVRRMARIAKEALE